MESPNHILCTKKLNETQQAQLSKSGQVTDFDIIETKPSIKYSTPKYEHIIFTSFKGCQYGLKALGESAKKYKFSCVGNQSFQLLTKKRLDISHHSGYANDLTGKLLETKSYSYITGSNRLNIIPDFLKENNILSEEITAYESIVSGLQIKNDFNCFLWFSPGGIKGFLDQHKIPSDTLHFCIGNTTKEALMQNVPQLPASNIHSLDQPSTNELIKLVVHKLSNL